MTFLFQRMKTELVKIEALYKKCAKVGCDESKMFKKEIWDGIPGNRTSHQPPTAQEFLDIMDNNFGACENSGSPYQTVRNWISTGALLGNCTVKDDLQRNFVLK